MEKISISVILPCYNVEKYIEQALLSLKKQTLSAIEIIAVDDGSQDNTWEIIKNYPDIISIHKVNGGYGSAINLGLSIAKGEYIAILEPDDSVIIDYYYILYEEAKRDNLEAVFYNSYQEIRKGIKPSFIEQYKPDTDRILTDDDICTRLALGSVGITFGIYKKEFLDSKHIKLDETARAYHDVHFIGLVFALAERIKIISGAGYLYRRDIENQSVSDTKRYVYILDIIDSLWKEMGKRICSSKRKAALIGYSLLHLLTYYHKSKQAENFTLSDIILSKILAIARWEKIICSEPIKNFLLSHNYTRDLTVIKPYEIQPLSSYPQLSSYSDNAYFSQILSLFYFKIAKYMSHHTDQDFALLKDDLLFFLNIPLKKQNEYIILFFKYILHETSFFDINREFYFYSNILEYMYISSNIDIIKILYNIPKIYTALAEHPKLCYEIYKNIDNETLKKSIFVYNLSKKSEKEFLDYIQGKNIAIVGNSPCELGSNKGKIIDSHDIVIRFNNYSIEDKFVNDYGKKCTVWAITPNFKSLFPRKDLYQYDYVISSNISKRFHIDKLNFIYNYFIAGGKFFRIDVSDFLYESNLRTISAGLIFVSYLYKHINICNSIKLYGFSLVDHYDGKRHYFNTDPNDISSMTFHKWNEEAKYLKKITYKG